MKAIVRTAAARRSRLGNAQVASPTLAAQSAPLLARDRDSDGDGAYRLLGSLTPTSQLTSEVLAETRRTSKRLSRTRRRGPASGRVSQRLVSTDRSCTAPTTTSGWRASPARTPNRGHCPRGGRRPRLGRREQALVRGGNDQCDARSRRSRDRFRTSARPGLVLGFSWFQPRRARWLSAKRSRCSRSAGLQVPPSGVLLYRCHYSRDSGRREPVS